MAKRKLEDWEEKLAREGEAIKQMRSFGAGPKVQGKRIAGSRYNYKKTQVANLHNRDAAALHVGFAPDRTHG